MALRRFRYWLKRVLNDNRMCKQESRMRINSCIDSRFEQYSRQSRQYGDECQNKLYACGPKTNQFCYQDWQQKTKNVLRQCVGEWNGGPR